MAKRAAGFVVDPPDRARGTRCAVGPRPHVDLEPLERASADLELLAHPIRLAILGILVRRGGEVCVCDLEGALPVKQPTVSHHLRLLREAGWIDTVRKGVWAYYFVRPDILRSVRSRLENVVEGLT
jgi:ArsR family transcriptional regulator